VEHLAISGGKDERLVVRLSGAIDDVLELDEISLEVALKATDLSQLGALFGLDLPAIGPAEFNGRISGSNESIRSEGSALLGKTRFSGEWSGSIADDIRPNLRAVITSEHIRLRDIGIEPATKTPAIVDNARAAASRWWVGDDELPFADLRTFELDVELKADKVTGRTGFEMTDLSMHGTLEHGRLRIGPMSARSIGAAITALVVLDASLPEPEVQIDLKADGIDLGLFMSQWKTDSNFDGLVSVDLHLQSVGETADELRRSLEGSATFGVWGATFASEYGKEFLIGLGRVAMPDFNVKKAQRASCMGGAFTLEDGVAMSEVLLLESPDVTVVGSGKIDLARQEYDLRLVPRPRDPGLLSTAATVDVTGTLDSPKFRAVKTSLARTAAKAFYVNFSRFAGMFVSPILEKRVGERDMCVSVLGPRPARANPPEKPTAIPSES
jgi:uncharacterized protein involved in outer membrane biogenesis